MPWRFTSDPEEFAARAWDLLAQRPVDNTLGITILARVRAGTRWSTDPMLFGWHDDGEVNGAVLMTPPFELLLEVVDDDTAASLAASLTAAAQQVPGVNGRDRDVDVFAAAWVGTCRVTATTAMRQRLYRLGAIRSPSHPVAGRSRRAERKDVDLATRWIEAFADEAGSRAINVEAEVVERVADGRLSLWEDPDGQTVALAGRQNDVAGAARVGPVYTPPEHRRHGYGAAVTAACSREALRCGATDVVLFTDLANPISNSIYQQIGYVPVGDRKIVKFEPR